MCVCVCCGSCQGGVAAVCVRCGSCQGGVAAVCVCVVVAVREVWQLCVCCGSCAGDTARSDGQCDL